MRTVAHADAPSLASSTKAELEKSRKKDDLEEDHVKEPEGNVCGRKLLEQQKRFSEGVRWREEQMKLQLSVNKEKTWQSSTCQPRGGHEDAAGETGAWRRQ